MALSNEHKIRVYYTIKLPRFIHYLREKKLQEEMKICKNWKVWYYSKTMHINKDVISSAG